MHHFKLLSFITFNAILAAACGAQTHSEPKILPASDTPAAIELTERSSAQPLTYQDNSNREASHDLSESPASADCQPSTPNEDSEVIFLSGYEGSALSSVAVTGPDRTTQLARIVIEDGDRPLYIMASSYTPLIWSIEGNTKRVSKFVASRNSHSEGAGVGVVGLPDNKIEFLGRDCLSYFSGSKDSKYILAKAKWGTLIDRQPDHVYGAYTLNSMRLPSGVNKAKERDSLAIAKNDFNLSLYHPEGLLEVDAKAVIAPEPVKTYDVYPQEAGLAQLVEDGKLEPLEHGSFRIVKPITHFPADLSGGHSVKFILGQGVPMPKGDPGHSSIYSEETGECLTLSCVDF